MIHQNSLFSWHQFDMPKRSRLVCKALAEIGHPETDRRLCHKLGQMDMNYVRPAITRLIDDEVLVEVGSVKDLTTNRTVRKVWFKELQP